MATTPTSPDTGKPPVDPTPAQPPVAPSIKTFTQDEVDALVTKARRDEKDKLYRDLDSAKKKASELEDSIKVKEAEIEGLKSSSTEAQQLRAQLEKLQVEAQNASKRVETLLGEALDRQKDEFEKRMEALRLDAVRRELIASANGEVIPELVSGSTEEEIRASFAKAKERYTSIQAAVADRLKKEHEQNLKGALPPSQGGGAGQATDPVLSDPSSWRKLSPKEWEEQKAKIKEAAFKQAGLPMRT